MRCSPSVEQYAIPRDYASTRGDECNGIILLKENIMTSKYNMDNYVYILSDHVYTTNISEGCVIRNYAGIVQRLIIGG